MTVLRLVSTPAFIPHPSGNRKLVLFISSWLSTEELAPMGAQKMKHCSSKPHRAWVPIPQFPGEARAQNYMLALPKVVCLRIATRAGGKEKIKKKKKATGATGLFYQQQGDVLPVPAFPRFVS